jgi:hypothetical protein
VARPLVTCEILAQSDPKPSRVAREQSTTAVEHVLARDYDNQCDRLESMHKRWSRFSRKAVSGRCDPVPSFASAETAHPEAGYVSWSLRARSRLPVASNMKPAACQDRDPVGSNCGSGPRPLPGLRVFAAPADRLSGGSLADLSV